MDIEGNTIAISGARQGLGECITGAESSRSMAGLRP
jgi:hypothetical protein